jgi:hypothetical protein
MFVKIFEDLGKAKIQISYFSNQAQERLLSKFENINLLMFLKYRHFIGQSEHVFKNVFFIVAPTGESWSENLVKNAYLLPFTYLPDVREKKFLFSDAWAIAEAYVGFSWVSRICLHLSAGTCCDSFRT